MDQYHVESSQEQFGPNGLVKPFLNEIKSTNLKRKKIDTSLTKKTLLKNQNHIFWWT